MRSQIVSFHCVLRNKLGNVLSATYNRDVITAVDGDPGMLRGLADALQNLRKGEKRKIFLPAEKAYGFYDPDLVRDCPRHEVSNGQLLKIGDEVQGKGPRGERLTYRVVRADSHSVTMDANHPLAGQDLVFEIETTDARDATSEEVSESSPARGSGPRWIH